MENSDFIQKWAEIRTQGFVKYLFKRTLIFSIIIISILFILNYFLKVETTLQFIITAFLVINSGLIGFVSKWNYNEKEYKKFMNIN